MNEKINLIMEIRNMIDIMREKINPADPMYEELKDDFDTLNETVIELSDLIE